MAQAPLPVTFFNRDAVTVARELLGTTLVRRFPDGAQIAGAITETEAYVSESDLACHARAGRTKRTEVMYGLPGRAYVYLIYGMHWMLNVVTGAEGSPAAVLIRAILPLAGQSLIAGNRSNDGKRPLKARDLTNGPAKVCQALRIDGSFNGLTFTDAGSPLQIVPAGQPVEDEQVLVGPRVGIDNVPEPWRSMPWRFWVNQPDGSRRSGGGNSA